MNREIGHCKPRGRKGSHTAENRDAIDGGTGGTQPRLRESPEGPGTGPEGCVGGVCVMLAVAVAVAVAVDVLSVVLRLYWCPRVVLLSG